MTRNNNLKIRYNQLNNSIQKTLQQVDKNDIVAKRNLIKTITTIRTIKRKLYQPLELYERIYNQYYKQ